MTYISSLSITAPMRQSIQDLTAQYTQATAESSNSSRYADLGLQLGAQTGTSVSWKDQTDQLNAYTSSNTFATNRLSTTSTALDTLTSSANSVSKALITASSSGGYTASLTTDAQNALSTLTSTLNTSSGNQYVFGGLNTDTKPLTDYSSTSAAKTAVDNSFQTTFSTSQTSSAAGSITGDQMKAYLTSSAYTSQFTGSGWSNWSSASSTAITTNISSTQSATTSVSANDSAFRSLAEGYTMLTEFTGSNMSSDARAAVVTQAQSLINTGLAGLNTLTSNVGSTENAITAANSAASAQVNVLATSISSADTIDTTTLANTVAALKTQLDTSYTLTSALQKLSLTNYITGG